MRAYGSGGKNWNVGLSNFGLLSATQRQHWYLYKLTGQDHRGRGLTRDQASDLIDEAIKNKAQRAAGLTTVAEQLFSAMYRKAVESANIAGETWLRDHPESKFVIADPETNEYIGVHGVIGTAWITWPKRGSDLYKWLIQNMYDGQRKEIRIAHKYVDRLEGGLQLACQRAAYEVLRRSATSIGDIKLMYRGEEPLERQAA